MDSIFVIILKNFIMISKICRFDRIFLEFLFNKKIISFLTKKTLNQYSASEKS